MSLLEMRDIRKSFSGVSVLKGVQLTVESGEVHALLGENGAGKSTTISIIVEFVFLRSLYKKSTTISSLSGSVISAAICAGVNESIST